MVVARLVEGGFVRRARSGADRRSVTLSLAPRGRRLIDRAPDAAQERLIDAIERLPHVRRKQLASALGDLARAMDSAGRAPAMFFEDRRGKRAERRRG